MEAKARLNGINQLLADVYGENTRISSLLSDYLNDEQFDQIKNEKIDDFLDLFLFSIRCRFATISNGMRLYSILSDRYGLVVYPPKHWRRLAIHWVFPANVSVNCRRRLYIG